MSFRFSVFSFQNFQKTARFFVNRVVFIFALFSFVNRCAIDPGGTGAPPVRVILNFRIGEPRVSALVQFAPFDCILVKEYNINVDNYDKIVYNTIESREVRFIDTFICLYGTVSFLLECNGLIR